MPFHSTSVPASACPVPSLHWKLLSGRAWSWHASTFHTVSLSANSSSHRTGFFLACLLKSLSAQPYFKMATKVRIKTNKEQQKNDQNKQQTNKTPKQTHIKTTTHNPNNTQANRVYQYQCSLISALSSGCPTLPICLLLLFWKLAVYE